MKISPSLQGVAKAIQPQSSLRGSGDSHNEAIHKNIKAQKVDSRIFTQAAQSLSTPQGKKAESVFSNQPQAAGFLMKKRGCAAFLCGDKPSGLSHKQKANSSLFRKKPTPTLKPHTRSKQ